MELIFEHRSRRFVEINYLEEEVVALHSGLYCAGEEVLQQCECQVCVYGGVTESEGRRVEVTPSSVCRGHGHAASTPGLLTMAPPAPTDGPHHHHPPPTHTTPHEGRGRPHHGPRQDAAAGGQQ